MAARALRKSKRAKAQTGSRNFESRSNKERARIADQAMRALSIPLEHV
jgi:hypothetical protein